jgi:hypothetical protein
MAASSYFRSPPCTLCLVIYILVMYLAASLPALECDIPGCIRVSLEKHGGQVKGCGGAAAACSWHSCSAMRPIQAARPGPPTKEGRVRRLPAAPGGPPPPGRSSSSSRSRGQLVFCARKFCHISMQSLTNIISLNRECPVFRNVKGGKLVTII